MSKITVTIQDYEIGDLNRRIAQQIISDYGVNVAGEVEHYVSVQIEKQINAVVKKRLNTMINNIFKKGVIVSEKYEEKVEREPISDYVLKLATEFMTKANRDSYGNTKGGSPFQQIAAEVIGTELRKQTTEILQGVKADALAEAKKNVAALVSERLFDTSRVLPGVR